MTEEEEMELAEAEAALWRVLPDAHTIPSVLNGFTEPSVMGPLGVKPRLSFRRYHASVRGRHVAAT